MSQSIDGHSSDYYKKYSGVRTPETGYCKGLRKFAKLCGLEALRVGRLFLSAIQWKWEWENKKGLTKHLYNELLNNPNILKDDRRQIEMLYYSFWACHPPDHVINRKFEILNKLRQDKNQDHVLISRKDLGTAFGRYLHFDPKSGHLKVKQRVGLGDSKILEGEVEIGFQAEKFSYDDYLFENVASLLTYISPLPGNELFFYNFLDNKAHEGLMGKIKEPLPNIAKIVREEENCKDYIYIVKDESKPLKVKLSEVLYYEFNPASSELNAVLGENRKLSVQIKVVEEENELKFKFSCGEVEADSLSKLLGALKESIDDDEKTHLHFYNVSTGKVQQEL